MGGTYSQFVFLLRCKNYQNKLLNTGPLRSMSLKVVNPNEVKIIKQIFL